MTEATLRDLSSTAFRGPSAFRGQSASHGQSALWGFVQDHGLLSALVAVSVASHLAFMDFGRGKPPVLLAVREGISSVRLNALRRQAPLQDLKPKEVKKRTEKVEAEPTPDAEKLVRREVEQRVVRDTPSVEQIPIPKPQKREIPKYVEETVAAKPIERKLQEILPDAPEVQLVSQLAQAEANGARNKAIKSASYLFNPAPRYPPSELLEDKRTNRQTTIEVTVMVSPKGTVMWAKIKKSNGTPLKDRATLEAIREWRFTPPLNAAGEPVSEEVLLPYRFDPNLK